MTTPGTRIVVGLAVAVPLAFVAVFFVWPLGAMLQRGFVTDGRLDLGGFVDVFARARTLRILAQTLAFAVLGSLFSTVLGIPLAHVLYRLSFPGVGALRGLIVMPFVLPTVVVGVAFRTLLRRDGVLGFLGADGTFGEIVAALVFFNVAVVARTVGATWSGLDARREEAARSLGTGPARVFVTVTLPRLAPSIAASASVVFLFCATAFGVVLVLGGARYGTVETEIYTLTTQFLDLRAASALSIAQVVLVIVALIVAGRLGAGQGDRRSGLTRRLRRADAPAIVLAGLVAAALATPLVALVVRSLSTRDGWGIGNYIALGSTGERNALVIPVWQALGNSLLFAVAATVLALVIAVPASLVVGRRVRGSRLLGGLLLLPLGVSAVTIGFGFLITLDRPPLDLRASPLLVPIAQALVAVPLVLRTLVPAVQSIGDRMRQAAATLGASPLRVVRDVDLAQLGRPLAVATGFAFAVALGEFGATSFLSRPEWSTLPVAIYRLASRPGGDDFGMALAASVVLAVAAALAIGLVDVRRRRA